MKTKNGTNHKRIPVSVNTRNAIRNYVSAVSEKWTPLEIRYYCSAVFIFADYRFRNCLYC